MDKIMVSDFRLDLTMESGQFFRYKLIDGWYYISIRECLFRAKQEGDTLYFEGYKYKAGKIKKKISTAMITLFFSLDEPYDEILKSISCDKQLKIIINTYRGLRIIRQDPWECTISYIASQASNIPKHTASLHRLAETYGKELKLGQYRSFTFPIPGMLKDEKVIRQCGLGFRAPYLLSAQFNFGDESLHNLKKLPFKEAKQELISIHGVSDKISECIMLYSLGFYEAFPIDVWIKKSLIKRYFNNKNTSNAKLYEFAREYFGKYAGYAQLFIYMGDRKKSQLN